MTIIVDTVEVFIMRMNVKNITNVKSITNVKTSIDVKKKNEKKRRHVW